MGREARPDPRPGGWIPSRVLRARQGGRRRRRPSLEHDVAAGGGGGVGGGAGDTAAAARLEQLLAAAGQVRVARRGRHPLPHAVPPPLAAGPPGGGGGLGEGVVFDAQQLEGEGEALARVGEVPLDLARVKELEDLAARGVLVDGPLRGEELALKELNGSLVELGAVDDEVLRVRMTGG